MPSAQKVSWAQLKVGVLALVALAIVGWLVFLLTGSQKLFSSDVHLYTYLDDAAAMTKGAAVRLNGVLIGKVSSIDLTGDRTPNRVIRIEMELDKEMLKQIPADSQATISSETVLAGKYINIKKGKSAAMVQPNAELQSLDTTSFDDVVASGYNAVTALQGLVKRVDAIVGIVESGKGSIGKLLVDEELYNRVIRIADDVEKLSKALSSNEGTIGKLIYDKELYSDIRTSLARLDTIVVDLQEGKGAAGKFLKDPALYDESHRTVVELRKLLDDLNAGKGSAGKFLKTDELHNQLQGTIHRIDNLLDKVNAGQGTLGQLLVNQQLYDTLNGATAELKGLIQDFRSNPKKFLRIKLGLF